jgi:hypothetical protein
MKSRPGVGLQRSRRTPFGRLPNLRNPMAGAFFFFWLWYATDTIYNVGRGTLKIGRFIGSGLLNGRTASPETLRKNPAGLVQGASAGASAPARAAELGLFETAAQ